jgi:hypothetical protein
MKITLTLMTGAMRSGTSVLGKIVGSFEQVEFFYEPMTFVRLLLNDSCKGLVDDYVYFDLLMPSLAGRNINLNANDDSSIRNYKSAGFIDKRLARSWPADVIHESNEAVTCLVKYPSYADELAGFESAIYPTKKIYIVREPIGNVLSILQKRWFHDEVIQGGIRGEFKRVGTRNVPLWLREQDVDDFMRLDETGRCLFYYNQVLSARLDKFDVVVSYEGLCNYPAETVENLQRKLNLKSGEMTEMLVSRMRPEQIKSLDVNEGNKALFDEAMSNYRSVLARVNV